MSPPVAVYVVAAVVSAAAVFAFKEFVYEPHLAPTFEAWAENFLERRRAARNRRASAVPVRTSHRRTSHSSSVSSNHDDGPQGDQRGSDRPSGPQNFSVDDGLELEALVSREVDEWRNEVLRSQERVGVRRRRTRRSMDKFDGFDSMSTTVDESFTSLTHTPLASTHVISNVSTPITQSTVSLPHTPTHRLRSESQSTTTQGDRTPFVAPHSPVREIPVISPVTEPSGSAAPTPRPIATDSSRHLDVTSPSPLEIPSTDRRFPTGEAAPHPLPFTPTYQVVADDSPFGPLLPDTPRSSAEMYGERPFSPITRVMGSSSDSGSTAGSRGTLPSRANSLNSSRILGNSGVLRKPSGLANEVVMGGSDDGDSDKEDHRASASTFTLANAGPGTNESVISSLSERYPAPPTPPVIVSPPASSIGIISAPSSPRSGGSDVPVVVQHDPDSAPQIRPSPPVLQLPSNASLSPGLISRSRSSGHSATSSAPSFASFLSPMPVSRTASESEGDEFLSVASEESDWGVSPVTLSHTGPVRDAAHNPFLDLGRRRTSSEDGDGSEGSEVLVFDLGQEGESEVGSDESWGSARKR